MSHDRTAANILSKLRGAQELMEEVQILIARDRDVLLACSNVAAFDICRTATVVDALASSVRLGAICRSDCAFHDGEKLGRGRHEYAARKRPVWKRHLRLVEARVRDLRERGQDNIAEWHESVADELRAKLADIDS